MTIRHLLILSVVVFYWILPQHSSAQNYTVLNDASVYSGCNCYRLTPAVNNQGGGVYQNNTINLNNSFDYTFNVFLGCNGAGGADGIVFILTNNIQGIGAQGGGLGYSGLPGNSLAIEYDTWQNSQDPSFDHIAIESGGSVNHNVAGPVSALASQSNIDDCAQHTTEIIWNVNTQTYSVYFDGVLRLSYTGNIVSAFFNGNPIVNWGWSGSTGGGNNDQRFCVTSSSSWVAGTNYQSCSNTMQFTDISTSNIGTVQSWAWSFGDPASGASNTSALQNPTHTFSATGTYTVTLTITDRTGCTNAYSHIVTINPPISLSAANAQPACNGGSTGGITLTTTGGFGAAAGYGGYQYSWSNGITAPNQSGVTSGTYNVTVTDGVCSATGSYTLNQPPALTASTSHTDASCGASNGSVSMTITGGTPPYTGVNWNLVPAAGSGSGPYTRTSIPAATYVADFHDANGCSALLTYRETVANLPCGYSVSTSSTDVTCFGGSNGTATLTVTGGVGTIVISWTNSGGTTVSNSANATNLPAGVYTYHYSDGSGQTFTGNVTVNQPGAAMVASLTTTNATCSYLSNGSAVASVTANGTPSYSYAWSPGVHANSATATGFGPGAVSVVITDNNGCTATASGTISTQPAIVPGPMTIINDSCYLSRTGSATISPTGGTPSYSYQWNNSPTAIGSGNYGIGAGTYTVTITDQNSCTATASGTVTQPASALTETMSHTDITCFGSNNGSATVTPAGGNGGYVYSWSPGAGTTGTISPLGPNKYYVTVTDSKNCKVSDSVTVVEPTAFTVTETHVNVKCKGLPTGSITLTLSGGTTAYGTVTWADGPTGATRTNLPAGSYTYTVLDAKGCQATATISITEPATAFTVSQTHVDVLCFGNNTGSINLTQAGGTPPYAVPQWLDLALGTTRSNLTAGTYYYGDTDNNGCRVIDSVKILQPASAFSVTATHTNVSCNGGNNGTITLTLSGGTTAYGAVTWTGSPGASGTAPTGLSAGTYNYSVSDANGCPASGTVTITQPALAFSATAAHTNVSCNGGSNGTITLTLAGGTTAYGAVTWTGTPGASGTAPTGLSAGTYNYSVADANGCPASGTVTITQPASAFNVTSAHTNVSCNGGNNGAITLTLTGGTTAYGAVTWTGSPGASGTAPTGLSAGTYNYSVSDANGCPASGTVVVTEPSVPFSVTATHTDVSCNGGNNGTITLTLNGGTTAYGAVAWTGGPGASGTAPSGLSAGTYNYSVSDANGCSASGTLTIAQPAAPFSVTAAHTNVSCNGGNNGTITLTLAGGTTAYGAVTWTGSPGASGTAPTGLSAGTYNYSVADANGCPASGTVTITQPASAFSVTAAHTDVSCNGGTNGSITLTLTGGTTAYGSVIWTGSPGASGTAPTGLSAGTYNYSVSDANGCPASGTVTVTEPSSAFSITATHTDVSCNGGNNGTITLTLSGGTTAYGSVTWTGHPGASGTAPTGLSAGTYNYSVSDANGCPASGTMTVTEPISPFSVTEAHTNVSCNGGSNGAITLTLAGGTTAYGAVTWTGSPGASGSAPTGLSAGTYNYSVADANGCPASGTVTLTEPATPFAISATHVDVLCFGNNTGSITLTPSGGTPPYATPQWLDGASGFTRTNLLAGTYSYGDTDANGCLVTGSVTITQPATGGMTVNVTKIDATCSYNNDGSATADVVGGVSPYNYAWSSGFNDNGVVTSTATGLAAIAYSVSVTDQNGCTALGTTTIGSQPRITAQISVVDVNCFGGSTGSITITAGGGVGGFHYGWSANAATGDQPNANNLSAGAYQVTITDGNGCVLDTFASVAQPAAALGFSGPVIRNISCNGGNDGAIIYTVNGGTPGYSFQWSGTAAGSNDSAVGLLAGSYDVTISDSKGCSVTNTAVITEPTAIVIGSQSQTNLSCNGSNNGTATISNVTGGTPGGVYTYTWSPNVSSGSSANSLSANTYTVTVKDNNQCAVTTSFVITEPSAILTPFIPTNVLCNNGSTGAITINASGGTPASTGYSYSWSPNVSTSNTASNLSANTYNITVGDSLGCTAVLTVQITEPTALVPIVVSTTNVSCSRDSNGQIQLSASGGVPAYSYAISSDGGVSYSVPNSTGLFTDLKIGPYTCQVTDANGCSNTISTTITAPDSVTVTIVTDTVKCYGDNNGALTVTSTGGTPGYTYDFSGGISNTTGLDQSLVAGLYGVTVTDSRGCAQTYTINVPQPDSLEIFVSPANPTVDLTQSLDLQAGSNAATEVMYTWSPADGLSNTVGSNTTVTTNNNQVYTLTGSINPHGKECKTSIQVPVTVVPNYNIFIPNTFTPNGDGINDEFEIYGNKKAIKFVEVSIFDRWGERVFHSTDIDFKWDGRYNGTLLEPNTFVYQISVVFIDNHAQPGYKGSLLLLR
jgi:gliding motility-associated-like protein